MEGAWPYPKQTWCNALLITDSDSFQGKWVAQLNILVTVSGDCVTLNASFEVQLRWYKSSCDECLAGESVEISDSRERINSWSLFLFFFVKDNAVLFLPVKEARIIDAGR